MPNEQLIKDIKHFEYTTKDRYEVMQNLLKKEYNQSEIIKEFDNYQFKSEWNGNILGFFMIGLAIWIGFSIKSTFGSFNYEFDSSGDFFRLNEWVFKPFLILALLFTGINASINKGFINKNTRLTLLIALVLFIVISISSNSPMSALAGIIGIVIYSLYKTATKESVSSAEIIINSIRRGANDHKVILKKVIAVDGKDWKGSSIFLFLLLAFCLLLNSPIDMTREITYQTANSTSYRPALQSIDTILVYGLKTLLLSSLIVSLFLSINYKKFRLLLFTLMGLSVIYIVATIFHSNFQVSIFPPLLIILSGAIKITLDKIALVEAKQDVH